MAQLPKGGLVRSYDKPIHWSCAIDPFQVAYPFFPPIYKGATTPFITIGSWGDSAAALVRTVMWDTFSKPPFWYPSASFQVPSLFDAIAKNQVCFPNNYPPGNENYPSKSIIGSLILGKAYFKVLFRFQGVYTSNLNRLQHWKWLVTKGTIH